MSIDIENPGADGAELSAALLDLVRLPARDYTQALPGRRFDIPHGATQTRGAFTIEANTSQWVNGVPISGGLQNPTLSIGYNVGCGAGPNRPVTSEPAAAWMIEASYQNDSTTDMEFYMEFTPSDATTGFSAWRPIIAFANRAGGRNSRRTFVRSLGFVGPDPTGDNGGITFKSAGDTIAEDELTYVFGRASFSMRGFSDVDTVLGVSSGAGHNSHVRLGANGTEGVFEIATASTTGADMRVGGNPSLIRIQSNYSQNSMSLAINSTDNLGALMVGMTGGYSAGYGVAVKQMASPTDGNYMIKLLSSSDVILGGVSKSGYFQVSVNSAPADAEVPPNSALLWFDGTNGAAKLMIKAKQANGTVRTGSVALA